MQKRGFLNQERTYKNGAILHYQVKTWEEFQRKITRGDAHLPRTRFSIARFQENDLNDIKSEVDENSILQIKNGIDNLRKLIGDYACVNTETSFFQNFYTNLLSTGLSDFQNHKLVHKVYKFVRKFRNTRL